MGRAPAGTPSLFAATLTLTIAGACGDDESIAPASSAGHAGEVASTGGSAARAGTASAGTSGAQGTGTDAGGTHADASVDVADASDAPARGCVDIHVTHRSLPPDAEGWSPRGPAIGVYSDRDHLWRDSRGVHVAWSAQHADGKVELVVSSYDATGASLGHRFFRSGGHIAFAAAGVAPDGTVGLAVTFQASDASSATYALLVIRTDDASREAVFPIPSWALSTLTVVGVGWDGEAFAVHGFAADNTQYVTRVKPDGTVLLAPTAFGKAYGYQHEIRYATDPVSGVSVGVSGRGAGAPWVTGHLRDGTPTPDPRSVQGFELKPQNFKRDAGWAGGVIWPTVRALPGGAAVAWSHGGTSFNVTTFIQALGTDLAPTADVIGLPAEKLPSSDEYDWNEWLTLQPRSGGWWLAGTNTENLNEYAVAGSVLANRRPIVTFSKGGQLRFPATLFESAAWDDELWLGFLDASNTTRAYEQPYRVVLAKPSCTYRSMYDLEAAP